MKIIKHQTIPELISKPLRMLKNKLWTLGHATIMGNETADRIVKAAAENMSKEDQMITAADVKTVAETSCLKKWQRLWDDKLWKMFVFIQENCRHKRKQSTQVHVSKLKDWILPG